MSDEHNETLLDDLAVDDAQFLTLNDDGTITVALASTVRVKIGKDYQDIDSLTFRKPKGRDWMATDKVKGDIKTTVCLASACSGTPIDVFEEMESEDFLRVLRVVGDFVGKGLVTSETS
jgi:hypothetical protein